MAAATIGFAGLRIRPVGRNIEVLSANLEAFAGFAYICLDITAMEDFHLTLDWCSLDQLRKVVAEKHTLKLSPEAHEKVQQCRDYLDQKIAGDGDPIYGINTGFGALCNTEIGREDLAKLQRNLVLSHACGTGEAVPKDIVRWMLVLKALSLSKGHSGVQVQTIQRLLDLANHNYLPVVFEQGSLGASGDLAPLAHLCLPLIGEGMVWSENHPKPTKELFFSLGWEGMELQAKEGLALINGTQFMSAYACHIVARAEALWTLANQVASMSLEAFDGRIEAFHPAVHEVRKQAGQIQAASDIRERLHDSAIMKQSKTHVQDPYSFRCIPQVHGASYDSIRYAKSIVENEINAVTDNPTVFPELDLVLSAGNFHGQPLALVLDQLAIALAEMGSIAERRTYKLLSGTRGLPAFLSPEPGLNSGFMIPQYTAASIVSQNKGYCFPASVDSIDSSNGQEDHVSMGANAATKALRVLSNVEQLVAIELMTAAQALDLQGPERASSANQALLKQFRKQVPFVECDEYLHPLLKKSLAFIDAWLLRN